ETAERHFPRDRTPVHRCLVAGGHVLVHYGRTAAIVARRSAGSDFRYSSGVWAVLRAMLSAPLEVLHGAIVPFGGRAAGERPQVATLTGLWVFLSRVQPVFPRFQLPNHSFNAAGTLGGGSGGAAGGTAASCCFA